MSSLLPGGYWLWTCRNLLLGKQKMGSHWTTKTKPACKIHIVIKCKRGWVYVYMCIHAQYWRFLSVDVFQLFLPISDLVAESWERSTSPIPWNGSPHCRTVCSPPSQISFGRHTASVTALSQLRPRSNAESGAPPCSTWEIEIKLATTWTATAGTQIMPVRQNYYEKA